MYNIVEEELYCMYCGKRTKHRKVLFFADVPVCEECYAEDRKKIKEV